MMVGRNLPTEVPPYFWTIHAEGGGGRTWEEVGEEEESGGRAEDEAGVEGWGGREER